VAPDELLEQAIAASTPPSPASRNNTFDRAIDRGYGMVDAGDQTFYASEVLFFVDYAVYCDLGARLCESAPQLDDADGTVE